MGHALLNHIKNLKLVGTVEVPTVEELKMHLVLHLYNKCFQNHLYAPSAINYYSCLIRGTLYI